MLTCLMLAIAVIGGCGAPPPVGEESSRSIAEAVGLSGAVEFRLVGPAGGPIDEPEPAGSTLTLAEAVRRAVTTDPGLQAAMARIRIAMADASQARLLPNPVLNIVFRWGPGWSGKPQIEASLAQDVVQVLQVRRRSSAADHRLREAAAEMLVIALDVTSEAQERYAAAQASAALVPLLHDRLALIDRLVETGRARVEAGEGARGDIATLDAQRVELLVELDGVRLSEREDRLRLARLIGEPSSAAAWVLDRWTAPEIVDRPEAEWVESALRHRPEIRAVAWRLAALGDDGALARLWPWEGASAGVDGVREEDWAIGPAVATPIPVFDTGQARRARISAEQMEARHHLTLARRKVVEEVRLAFETLAASRENLARIRDGLIPLQRQRRQLAEDAYRSGLTDVTALFLAEHDLRLAEARAVEVERRAATALIRLQRAVGGPGVAASLSGPASGSASPSAAPQDNVSTGGPRASFVNTIAGTAPPLK